jgi:hypothetical protein
MWMCDCVLGTSSEARVGHGRERREGSPTTVLMTYEGGVVWRGGFAWLRRLQVAEWSLGGGFSGASTCGLRGMAARVVGPTCW